MAVLVTLAAATRAGLIATRRHAGHALCGASGACPDGAGSITVTIDHPRCRPAPACSNPEGYKIVRESPSAKVTRGRPERGAATIVSSRGGSAPCTVFGGNWNSTGHGD